MSVQGTIVNVRSEIPGWVMVFGTVAALLLALGAGISLLSPQQLVAPGAEINAAVQIYARYTFSRDAGLFIVLCIGLVRRSRPVVNVMMGLFALISLFDAIMDIVESRLPIFVIAFVLFLIAALAFVKTADQASTSN